MIESGKPIGPNVRLPASGALAAAGAAAPEALRAALVRVAAAAERPLPRWPGAELRLDRPIRLDLSVPGLRAGPLRVPETDVVSGGAITTSMLFCLLRLPGLTADLRDATQVEGSLAVSEVVTRTDNSNCHGN